MAPVTRLQSARAASALVTIKKNGEAVLPVAQCEPEPKFTLFPNLPLELRLMIWKHATQPRVIRLSHYRVKWSRDKDQVKDPTGALRRKLFRDKPKVGNWCRTGAIKHKVPTILTTCKESREAGKERYRLCFEEELSGQKIWVDFSRDTIFFVDFYAFQAFYGKEQPWKVEGGNLNDVDLPRDTIIMEKKLQILVAGSILSSEVVKVLSRFQRLEKAILQEGPVYNVDQLKSDLMERWSNLERLPQVNLLDKNDLHAKYFIKHEEESDDDH